MTTFGVIGWAIHLKLSTEGELRNVFACFGTPRIQKKKKKKVYFVGLLWGFILTTMLSCIDVVYGKEQAQIQWAPDVTLCTILCSGDRHWMIGFSELCAEDKLLSSWMLFLYPHNTVQYAAQIHHQTNCAGYMCLRQTCNIIKYSRESDKMHLGCFHTWRIWSVCFRTFSCLVWFI